MDFASPWTVSEEMSCFDSIQITERPLQLFPGRFATTTQTITQFPQWANSRRQFIPLVIAMLR
jgi:hypothetical protein